MKLAHKSISLELKLDEGSRRISGYGSVFGNVDAYNDIVLAGAFAKSIAKRKVKMLFEHRDLLGIWDVVREDAKGLYLEGSIPETTLGNDVYKLAKAGALDSMSIGYRVVDSEYDKNIRLLKEVELYEVSLVTFPANEQATITGVKSAPQTERDFERFLREEGKFSHEAAKIITAKGFKALSGQRDVEASVLNSITKAINILKG